VLVSAKGLPGGSPSRDAEVQLKREIGVAKRRKRRRSRPIMSMDLPERERRVKRNPHDSC
jgi:hypothetical protein